MNKLFILLGLLFSQATFAHGFVKDLVAAAIERTTHNITYDGSYFSIKYPNGDVPENIGVCTDVIIRTYRALGYDLQKLVHEDMRKNFIAYPSKRIWNMKSTDKNIDHRRVPNLQAFFARHGKKLAVTSKAEDYAAGDIVTWMLPGNLPHIGIVTDRKSEESDALLVVHNIGSGPELEDMLFDYKITGHYRYEPKGYKSLNINLSVLQNSNSL